MSHSALSSFAASAAPQGITLLAVAQNLASLSSHRVSVGNGRLDGWPSNDVPLVVMYSADMANLTKMRRLTQQIGVRFLGYDRTSTLMDALSVLNPVAVLIDEADTAVAHRLGRQVRADNFGLTVVRLVNGSETEAQPNQQVVGSGITDDVEQDGPFLGKIQLESSPSRLAMALGRVGVLPRRLTVVRG